MNTCLSKLGNSFLNAQFHQKINLVSIENKTCYFSRFDDFSSTNQTLRDVTLNTGAFDICYYFVVTPAAMPVIDRFQLLGFRFFNDFVNLRLCAR